MFNASFEALGNLLSTTYKVVLNVALIVPLGNISIPFPGINLSCLLFKAVLISSTNCSNYSMSPAFVPTIPNNVFKTLSRVVTPKDVNPGTVAQLTTTASERVIGTKSEPDY